MYRFAALYDRMSGGDANNLVQSYTDIMPGRPTEVEHRDPSDDVRDHYDKNTAEPLTKLHAVTIMAAENQVHDYYMTIGPMFADPVARELYAEIASIEEQHTTQYESIIDANETWMEKWMMHEAMEVYNYYSCSVSETNPRIKKIWDRCLDYELGHLNHVMELFKKVERRDPAELLPATLPEPIDFVSHRQFIRETIENEVDLRADGTKFVDLENEPERSLAYREHINSEGSPSNTVAAGYVWTPGTELTLGLTAKGKGA